MPQAFQPTSPGPSCRFVPRPRYAFRGKLCTLEPQPLDLFCVLFRLLRLRLHLLRLHPPPSSLRLHLLLPAFAPSPPPPPLSFFPSPQTPHHPAAVSSPSMHHRALPRRPLAFPLPHRPLALPLPHRPLALPSPLPAEPSSSSSLHTLFLPRSTLSPTARRT